MTMDVKTIEYVANLARINIDESEKDSLVKDLVGVLGYVDQIQLIAKNIKDADIDYTLKNVASIDDYSNEQGIFTDSILNEAPGREGDYVSVKKVL